MAAASPTDRERRRIKRVIETRLPLGAIVGCPEILLHRAHPGSRLARHLAGAHDDPPPYWAFPWAGGLALARYILDRPEVVASRRVLDLGTGSGLVGIAAAKAGAAQVTAVDIDPRAGIAAALNAAANGAALAVETADVLDGPPPDVDLLLVGDLFYDANVAARVAPFLDRCRHAGLAVLIGDPGRAFLPRTTLRALASYRLTDVGDAGAASIASVFALSDAED